MYCSAFLEEDLLDPIGHGCRDGHGLIGFGRTDRLNPVSEVQFMHPVNPHDSLLSPSGRNLRLGFSNHPLRCDDSGNA
jgi:hypothetical protein